MSGWAGCDAGGRWHLLQPNIDRPAAEIDVGALAKDLWVRVDLTFDFGYERSLIVAPWQVPGILGMPRSLRTALALPNLNSTLAWLRPVAC